MKNIANIITCARIVMSLILLLLDPMSPVFYTVYALCGLTDIADGAAARITGFASRRGALFDSLADIVFVTAAAVCLLPGLIPLFSWWWMLPVFTVICVKLVTLAAGFIKFRRLCFLHTYFNKAVGGAVFLLPFFRFFCCFQLVSGIVLTAAFFAAAEELICILKIKKYSADLKGLFF